MEIPYFENTEEALKFGKTATPQQIKKMELERRSLLNKSNKAIAKGRYQEALDFACRAQFFRESLEATNQP